MKILKFTSQLLPNWLSELDQVPDGRLSLDNFSCFISLSDIPDEDSFRYILESVTTDSVNLILKDSPKIGAAENT
ncbi:MAG: hypothetical protein IPK04_03870 [Bdellovibrionales bacterium]|nr:hypothetical protein [Bdellovibrionales bacterium]